MIRLAALLSLGLALPAIAQDPRILPEAEQSQWNAVGRVNVAGLKTTTMCSGTLIAADLVLTAAHCLYRGTRPARPEDVHFVAGWRSGAYAAHRVATELMVDPRHDPALPPLAALAPRDIAFLRLAAPIPDTEVAPMALAALPDPAPPLVIVGYRRDRPHALSRQAPCAVVYREPDQIGLDCAVIPGSSGAPVLWLSPQGWRVVALVSASVAGAGPVGALAPLVPLAPSPQGPGD
ncbi:serine protease [Tropicimonas sp. IMCC34043]|uniref:trypsin-like serine peptidase n=1 Tax=Tropicimonas sp. IMCC34043 TaxID=2248760 RepID=UPI000E249B8D|nr:serine protease [Tropicimonas sp. IMCC34043]